MPDFDKLKPPDRGPPGSELLRPILRPPEKPKPRPTVDPSIAVDVGRLIGDTAKHYGGNLLDFLIGGHAPGSKYTGEGAAFKKLLEDLGGLVFPGRLLLLRNRVPVFVFMRAGVCAGVAHHAQ